MNLIISILIALLITVSLQQADTDKGIARLNKMRQISLESANRIIKFSSKNFTEYVMRYPRPYDVVIYFFADEIPLSAQLFTQFNYTVRLHAQQGAIDKPYPTFFARIDFSQQTYNIFGYFQFNSAPNLVVSKPKMAILGESQGSSQVQFYLKSMCWRISHTDGEVTTRKMLEFINKRTHLDIVYKVSKQKIQQMLTIFLIVAVSSVLVYKLLKFIWGNWFFWFIMSMVIYITCMTGIVHEILNGNISEQWKNIARTSRIFQQSGREQTFLQGCFVSLIISMTGIAMIIIAVSGQKIRQRYSAIIGIVGIIFVYYAINYIQLVYSNKSHYGPSFKPPEWYKHGPLSVDQGNNI